MIALVAFVAWGFALFGWWAEARRASDLEEALDTERRAVLALIVAAREGRLHIKQHPLGAVGGRRADATRMALLIGAILAVNFAGLKGRG